MSLILALDQSTSATKALLFDRDGRALDRESREHRQHYPQPGWVEHDAEEIWQNTLATVRALLARNATRVAEIAALSITNQRETIVVFDRATGKPLHRAIVWQCRRSDALCAAHVAAGAEPLVRRKTGLKIDAYFSASKLQWLVRERADLRAKLVEGSALIGTIDAYLVYRLTGGDVFATDSTNASRTLLFDITRLTWDDELCALWEVPRRALPDVRESAACFGTTTLDGILPAAVRIRGVIGDSQGSLFAQRCFELGSAKVTFGTGSSVLLNVGHVVPSTAGGAVATLAWELGGKPVYAVEGIINSSAATIAWLRDQLRLFATAEESEALAREVGGSEGVFLVPAFSGLGAPYWANAARAAIVGLSGRSDRRHVARAALESIGFQLRDVLDLLRVESGVVVRSLHGDGGATANSFLMQFCADIAQTELRVATDSNLSALGAAWMGLLGLGIYPGLGSLRRLPRGETVYRAELQPEYVDDMLRQWHGAVRQVLAGLGVERREVAPLVSR